MDNNKKRQVGEPISTTNNSHLTVPTVDTHISPSTSPSTSEKRKSVNLSSIFHLKEKEKDKDKKEEKEKQKIKEEEEKELKSKLKELEKQRNKEHEKEEKEKQKQREKEEKEFKKLQKKLKKSSKSSSSNSTTNTSNDLTNDNDNTDDASIQTDTSTYSTRSVDYYGNSSYDPFHPYDNHSSISTTSSANNSIKEKEKSKRTSLASDLSNFVMKKLHVSHSHTGSNNNNTTDTSPSSPVSPTLQSPPQTPQVTGTSSNNNNNSNTLDNSKSTPTSPTKIGIGISRQDSNVSNSSHVSAPTTTSNTLTPFPLGQHRGNSKNNILNKPTKSAISDNDMTDESDTTLSSATNNTVIELPSLSIDPPKSSSPTQQLRSPLNQQLLSSPFVVSTPSSSPSPYLSSTNQYRNSLQLPQHQQQQQQSDSLTQSASCSSSPKTFISHSPSIPLFLQQQSDPGAIDLSGSFQHQPYPHPAINHQQHHQHEEISEETLQKSAICKRKMEDFYSYLFECENNSRYNPLMHKRKISQKKSMLEINLKQTLNKNKQPPALRQLLFGSIPQSLSSSQQQKEQQLPQQQQPQPSLLSLSTSADYEAPTSHHIFNRFQRDHKRSYSTNTPSDEAVRNNSNHLTTNSPVYHTSASNLETVFKESDPPSSNHKRRPTNEHNFIRRKFNSNRLSLTLSHNQNRNSNLERANNTTYSNDTTNSNSIPPSSSSASNNNNNNNNKQPFSNILPTFDGGKFKKHIKGLFNDGISKPNIQIPSFQLKKNNLFSFGKNKNKNSNLNDSSSNDNSNLSKNINSVLNSLSNDDDFEDIRGSSGDDSSVILVEFQRPRNRMLSKAYREMLQLRPKTIEISDLKKLNDNLEIKIMKQSKELGELELKTQQFKLELLSNFKLLEESSEQSIQFVLMNQERQFQIQSKLDKTRPYINTTLTAITKLFEKSKSLENTVQILRRTKKSSPYINILYRFFMISYIIFIFNFIVNKLSTTTTNQQYQQKYQQYQKSQQINSPSSSPNLPAVATMYQPRQQYDLENNKSEASTVIDNSGAESNNNNNNNNNYKQEETINRNGSAENIANEDIKPQYNNKSKPIKNKEDNENDPSSVQIDQQANKSQKVMKIAKFNLEAMSKSIAKMRERDDQFDSDGIGY